MNRKAMAVGQEKRSSRTYEVKKVIQRLTEDCAWDHLHSKDLDPKIVNHVCELLRSGMEARDVAHSVGLQVQSKPWKKILSAIRSGFRADAESYLYQQTHKFYKVLDRAREKLEDAFENGTPQMTKSGDVVRLQGVTGELSSFLKAYTEAVKMPIQLWKEFGAIGEKSQNQGVTILVQNNIPLPSADEIVRAQEEAKKRVEDIELKAKKLLGHEV